MDVKALVEAFQDSDREARSMYHITLGQLIVALRGFEPDAIVSDQASEGGEGES